MHEKPGWWSAVTCDEIENTPDSVSINPSERINY